MKPKLYLETSVVSYQISRASRDVIIAGNQQSTHLLWERLEDDFRPFVSALVIEEASRGNPDKVKQRLCIIASFHVIKNTPEAESLARKIIANGGIPKEYPEDALHIALAAIGGMDFIVTWNLFPYEQSVYQDAHPMDGRE
uniref:PIN domain n=2 Tax=unclassified Candidatus Kentrum TaxID=2643149 RepID=A0A451AWP2_9GAMM|nr:MAG: PIN domain [Candidatus Kentron sp. LPFa]VFK61606.1 MAG: PIN domain [Candidatus Kentron sp. UNK]VFK70455.1 MAG: PIN domain [Candidatus Kentron sp. UNK]